MTGDGVDDVDRLLAGVEPASKQADAQRLDTFFRDVTGFQPRIWGGGMVGYGAYSYTYDSGHSGRCLATGFRPSRAKFSIYIMPGYADFGHILERLGKHKMGKACLYVNKLADVDLSVLSELVTAGLNDLARQWPIEPK